MKNPLASLFLALLVCLAALAFHPGAAFAGVADMPSAGEDVRAQLEAAKETAAVIENSPNYAAGAPATASDDELKLRRYFARETVRSYESVVRNMARAKELKVELDHAKQQAEQWTAVAGGPPHSIIVADQLAAEAQLAESQYLSRKTRQELIRTMRDTLSQSLKDTAAAVRQQEEQLALAAGPQKTAIGWGLELMRHRMRTQATLLKSLDIAEEASQLEIAIARARLDLAQRKADSVIDKVAFPERELQQIRVGLAAESAALSAELTRMADAAKAASDRLDRAREALALVEAAAAGGQPARGTPTESLWLNVALAEADVAAANTLLDYVRYRPGVQEVKRVLWTYRYRLHNERTPQLVADVKAALNQLSKSLGALTRLAERQKAVLAMETTEVEQEPHASVTDDALRLRMQRLANNAEREKALRNLTAFYASVQSLMDRLGMELGERAAESGTRQRVAGAALYGKRLLDDLWNFEIFAIEDTIEVDGRKVTGLASVTVGKVVRAVAIFTAGVLLIYWLARLAATLFIGRFGYDAARAHILGKWLFAIGLLVLLVAVLLWVRIPLTVFAFLGGAVAIGLGFGMQNLLKNLISGLMLLFEGPFKPGDLVEVGPLRGTVVEIGIRSSVIRDINGVDSLIPNSTFVEQSVTNWTYESPKVRFGIKVGVAYGSPVDEVARLLEECVARHGLVLKDPPPEILFEDFGADALEFAIYYWMELSPKVTSRRVASDLRFIIEKSLREHGIVIAFPQRDVHIDAAAPLRVQVVKE